MPKFKVKNSIALVTGANRGIGRAFVVRLLAAGASKVYAAARNIEQAADLVAAGDGKVEALRLDVNDDAGVAAAAKAAPDVNLLINNAGVANFGGTLSAENLEGARRDFETNVFGLMKVTRAFAPALRERRGALVNLASIAGLINFPLAGTYSASKAAVHSLTQNLRYELAPDGVLVVGVYPGPIDTEMGADLPFEKAPPSSVADAVIEALEAGDEEVFPDPMAREMAEQLRKDAKAVERSLAASASEGR